MWKYETILPRHSGGHLPVQCSNCFSFFSLSIDQSGLAGAGKGVYISRGEVLAGSLVCLYPGTVYQPQDPVLLQSLGNQFILRCCDGLLLDGNNRGFLSPLIFRSCTGREQVTFLTTHVVMSSSCSLSADWNGEGSGHQLADCLACQSSVCRPGRKYSSGLW